jgi:hypothetical protein
MENSQQSLVAASMMQAEFVVCYEAIGQVCGLRILLQDLR